jgi:hypothetical protein
VVQSRQSFAGANSIVKIVLDRIGWSGIMRVELGKALCCVRSVVDHDQLSIRLLRL